MQRGMKQLDCNHCSIVQYDLNNIMGGPMSIKNCQYERGNTEHATRTQIVVPLNIKSIYFIKSLGTWLSWS